MTPSGSPSFVGIHHVQLVGPLGGEAAARRFYGEFLGLLEIDRAAEPPAESVVAFECGEQELRIAFMRDFQVACTARVSLLMVNPTTLGALQVNLELEGLAVQADDSLPRYRRFLVSDPFGNRLEFISPRY